MNTRVPMYDVNCPYCDADLEICHDDGYGYEEDRVHEQECPECDKTFAYTTSTSFHYEVNKADCLNGADHAWEPMKIYPKHWPDAKRCADCGLEERGRFVELESSS